MSTYKIMFFRSLTGERGDVQDVDMKPYIKTSGLSKKRAEKTKRRLENSFVWIATRFSIVEES